MFLSITTCISMIVRHFYELLSFGVFYGENECIKNIFFFFFFSFNGVQYRRKIREKRRVRARLMIPRLGTINAENCVLVNNRKKKRKEEKKGTKFRGRSVKRVYDKTCTVNQTTKIVGARGCLMARQTVLYRAVRYVQTLSVCFNLQSSLPTLTNRTWDKEIKYKAYSERYL